MEKPKAPENMVTYDPDHPLYEYVHCCEYLSHIRDLAEESVEAPEE